MSVGRTGELRTVWSPADVRSSRGKPTETVMRRDTRRTVKHVAKSREYHHGQKKRENGTVESRYVGQYSIYCVDDDQPDEHREERGNRRELHIAPGRLIIRGTVGSFKRTKCPFESPHHWWE